MAMLTMAAGSHPSDYDLPGGAVDYDLAEDTHGPAPQRQGLASDTARVRRRGNRVYIHIWYRARHTHPPLHDGEAHSHIYDEAHSHHIHTYIRIYNMDTETRPSYPCSDYPISHDLIRQPKPSTPLPHPAHAPSPPLSPNSP